MSHPVWSERYNCHRTTVGAFVIEVSWDRDGYQSRFNGAPIRGTKSDLDSAKKHALAFARRELVAALKQCELLERA